MKFKKPLICIICESFLVHPLLLFAHKTPYFACKILYFIPFILIDPKSTGFPTIEWYQILEFNSIIIYTRYQYVSQVLMLLVGQNDLQ